MRKKSISLLLASCVAIFCSRGCSTERSGTRSSTAQAETDAQRVLSWFPADTETLLVANGPFWMSSFQVAQNYQNYEVSSQELEKDLEGLTLALFNSKSGVLEKHLEGKKVLFATEGSRHFRSPAGLGELPYEGCAIAIFGDDLGDRRDSFMKDAAPIALRMEELEGQKIAVFQERSENDIWTIFVAFPQKRVVLVATNRDFLQEVLARMRGAGGEKAFPETLPEWQYVNKKAQFWGLRHFDRRQAKEDPTSPFGGKKSANVPDEQAVGLTYQCDPRRERKVTLTYLSGEKVIMKIEEKRFPSISEGSPGATEGLHIQYHELGPAVIQSTYDVDHSQPLSWFLFVFMGSLGHAVYL
jgi:hypothetical protein